MLDGGIKNKMLGYLFVLGAVFATSAGVVVYKKYTRSKNVVTLITTIVLLLLAPISSFNALQYLTVDVVYMATSLNGLIVLCMSQFFLKENVEYNQLLGAVLVFVGVSIYMV